MEADVHAELYYRRPNSSENHLQQKQHYSPPPLPNFEQRSPQIRPKINALTTQNLAAVSLNGFRPSAVGTGLDRDPDDFQREYRGGQTTTGSYTDITSPNMASSTDTRPAPISSRSNGNGTTPKHPTLPLAARTALKPAYRSASSPLDSRPSALSANKPATNFNGKPSVKDLLKRFDQNNESSGSTAPKPPMRINTRDVNGSAYMKDRIGYQARSTNTQNVPSVSRAGSATREPEIGRVKSPTNGRSTQRTRFVEEDTHSSNTRSTAARTTRTRQAVSGGGFPASKSMTNLSPTSPKVPQRKPLFGEVVPVGQINGDIGYGISRAAIRRISDSSLHPSWSHQRSKSEAEDFPSSPTAWYRGANPGSDDFETNKLLRQPGHNRNHSDFLDTKVNTMNGVSPSFPTVSSPPTSTPQQSRLPVLASRRHSNSSDSVPSSQSSTRANSPYAAKAVSSANLRRPSVSTPWNSGIVQPAALPKPATTPNHHTNRSKIRGPAESNSNNASLKAYISAPLPKTSPPLRSSRPRQPVSSASTASSKTKTVDRAGSPQQIRTGMKLTRTGGETTSAAGDARERKERNIPNVQLTAQDFAARRDLIRRAYTKSIHESEQKQIRADNLRRLNERHGRSRSSTTTETDVPQQPVTSPVVEQPELPRITSPEPLHIETSFPVSQKTRREEIVPVDQDSPTLGIPGSFIDDDDEEPPHSAISCATGTTEIENEPQTEAPRLSHMTSRPNGFSSHVTHLDGQLSPEQAFFGMQYTDMEVDEESIQIMLDATTPLEEHIPEVTPTNNEFDKQPLMSGVLRQDTELIPEKDEHIPIFASVVTTASPPRAHRNHPKVNTSFASENPHMPESEDVSLIFDAHALSDSPSESETTPEFTSEEQFAQVPEKSDTPKLELPVLRTALRPESFAESDRSHDFLNTPLTDIEYESSDGAGIMNSSILAKFSEAYDNRARDAQASPRTSLPSNRSSWTDYALETTDQYSNQAVYPSSSPPMEVERAPTPPPKELSVSPMVPPKDEGYSPQPSPRVSHFSQNELPPLPNENGLGLGIRDTNAGFGIATVLTPVWPEYSIPLPPFVPEEGPLAAPTRTPPPPSLYNRRPPSSLYDSSQNGASRNTESRRASDDLYSVRASNSTPRSSTQISFDDAATDKSGKTPSVPVILTEEEKEAAEKNRKRLFHRRMVIKELVDTESVYLKDMNVVEEIYKGTAEACPNLEVGDVKTIFRNTDEIVQFSTMFLDELKSAASSVYSPRSLKSRHNRNTGSTTGTSISPPADDRLPIAATLTDDTDEHKDRQTFIGANFRKHLKKMQVIYTEFLKNSELASTRLAVLQDDAAVKVWLSECNLVAKDLTQAWDLDALLVKPVQRITRYQLLLVQIKESTPEDHPDFLALQAARTEISSLLANIDALKKRIHMVGQIVGRKRKESDVRSGLAKAFGRREKLSTNTNRPQDDAAYLTAHERFSDDYLRLQVILRDVEYYTRETTSYTTGFLRYLSSMELIMRLGASNYPEIESKWVRFNLSMRDMESVALEDHVSKIRKKVLEPIEQIIALYGPPNLAMKKRHKRRFDYEKFLQLKGQGKKIDEKLTVLVSEYEALNETLKLELPKLSSLTEVIGNVCCIQLVHLQAEWWNIWQTKMRVVLEESQVPKEVADIVDMFNRDYKYTEAQLNGLSIVNGTFGGGAMTRASTHSTTEDNTRPSNVSTRSRGPSIHSEKSPTLPNSDFSNRLSGQFVLSPFTATAPGLPQYAYQPQAYSNGHARAGSNSPATPDTSNSQRHHPPLSTRPTTGRSHGSEGATRMSTDYNTQHRRESGSTYNSAAHHVDGPPMSGRPYSGIFHSAMPMPDGPDESYRSSRASSRDRNTGSNFNVLYLAASLFEFNISATKQEAGYPYLTYQAGEIFDVIAEKGELWLAKNQDDSTEQVGWIWSKHFARLAND